MTTLKDHQQAMVDLMASGSGIPASAMRLAHAMHDVLEYLQPKSVSNRREIFASLMQSDATTPGLNDQALAADVEACRPKDTMFDRARAAECRVKGLENTVNQLRKSNAVLREQLREMVEARQRDEKRALIAAANEQAGCRKDDTQVCEHKNHSINMLNKTLECHDCGWVISWPEDFDPQAHMRETIRAQNSCIHNWQQTIDVDFRKCVICGAVEDIYQ